LDQFITKGAVPPEIPQLDKRLEPRLIRGVYRAEEAGLADLLRDLREQGVDAVLLHALDGLPFRVPHPLPQGDLRPARGHILKAIGLFGQPGFFGLAGNGAFVLVAHVVLLHRVV
jgi:hypothetical protein